MEFPRQEYWNGLTFSSPGDLPDTGIEPGSPAFQGFPCSSIGRVCLQCRRPRFNSSVRKIPWRRKWPSTPVFLPGNSHGQRSLEGYSPWVAEESDMTEHVSTSFTCVPAVCVCMPEPGSCHYWARVLQLLKPACPRAQAPQQEKPPQWEAHALHLESSLRCHREKHTHSNEGPAQPKINIKK